jgi:glycyl-tRNA synthetase beta chain
MDDRQDLLIEIGTEELPPSALPALSAALSDRFAKQLSAAGLPHGQVARFATPRRLALIVEGLATAQADQEQVRRGPAVKAAFDDQGAPTKAALGFAQSCGVEVSELDQQDSDKGSWLIHRRVEQGRSTLSLLPEMASAALAELPIPKRMRWGSSEVSFVRPVHWVCMLFGEETVPGTLMDLPIGRSTRGHRFHHPDAIELRSPAEYLPSLREASVEPDFELRRTRIEEEVHRLANSVGGVADMPDGLLDEVTSLCEWPVALLGGFDEEFLEVPAEVLIETMQHHQKYFAVLDRTGGVLPHFVTVSNIRSQTPDIVRLGNERVIRPRFTDARFFWEQDLKVPLSERLPELDRIVFQRDLGSVGDKVRRVAQLSRQIAYQLGYDADLAERSARLSKCDLVTAMVSEFASLQGVMGRHYAMRGGEAPCVASAMEEQYLPRHAGDALPSSECGQVLALADRLDTLLAIFSIGERPTGVKDPYGLRRASIGVLRILIEKDLPLDLRDLLTASATTFPDASKAQASVEPVFEYVTERLRAYYADQQVEAAAVAAVLSVGISKPNDFDRRVHAVSSFARLEPAQALAAANKRIANILKKNDFDDLQDLRVRPELLSEPAEQALGHQLNLMAERIRPLLAEQRYEDALRTLSSMRPDVDRFFDEVMVMDKDEELRNNRLALLHGLRQMFSSIADISKLGSSENA